MTLPFTLTMTMEKGAAFSPCRKWRYRLWRIWDPTRPPLMVIGLNPSTADETLDDPTIRRCLGFARAWGHGGLYMANAFAYRATDPEAMKAQTDPVGPGNDAALLEMSKQCSLILAAWGVHGAFRGRDQQVLELIRKPLHCLKRTKEGHPGHPLYIAARTKPQLFRVAAGEGLGAATSRP